MCPRNSVGCERCDLMKKRRRSSCLASSVRGWDKTGSERETPRHPYSLTQSRPSVVSSNITRRHENKPPLSRFFLFLSPNSNVRQIDKETMLKSTHKGDVLSFMSLCTKDYCFFFHLRARGKEKSREVETTCGAILMQSRKLLTKLRLLIVALKLCGLWLKLVSCDVLYLVIQYNHTHTHSHKSASD